MLIGATPMWSVDFKLKLFSLPHPLKHSGFKGSLLMHFLNKVSHSKCLLKTSRDVQYLYWLYQMEREAVYILNGNSKLTTLCTTVSLLRFIRYPYLFSY